MQPVTDTRSLYQRLLGGDWDHLAGPLQRFHGSTQPVTGSGVFRVRNGGKFYGGILARILGLPLAGEAVPVRLLVTPHACGERWERIFGARSLITEESEREGHLLVDLFRFLEFLFELRVLHGALVFKQVGVAICLGRRRFRLPQALSPFIAARTWSELNENTFQVAVTIRLPGIGECVSYEGTLLEEP